MVLLHQLLIRYKSIIENILSLTLLNVVNLILPLLTLPYIIRTVGLSNYGAYSVIYTIIQYVLLFSTFGFNYSTTKEVSQKRESIEEVSAIVKSTIYARFLISSVAIMLFAAFIYLYYPSNYYYSFLFGIGIILGDVMNPVWLYQGMEKMKYMTIINLVCKLTFTLLIFVFIKNEKDWLYITLLYSCGYILSGVISLIMSIKVFGIKSVKISLRDIFRQIKQGWSVFLSTFFISFYRNSNIFILGFFVNEFNLGIYASAEKTVKAVQSLATPISNALFPHMALSFKSKTIAESARHTMRISKKLSLLYLLLIILFVICSKQLSIILLGSKNVLFIRLILLMSPVILFGGINYLLGIVGLVNLSYSRNFLRFVIISGIISIIVLVGFVGVFDIYSGAFAMLATESLLTIMCYRMIAKLCK